ncbi:hypothetical protein GDO81_007232 [Engystomops pustulosus]|uniref:Uncharacterized protein n=1 Tax=Engystomops pustulosus TaxID=76066 RepID=A0AAV7C7D1_ENGPU|nr:hypothetical protein GDO81_007232 [Engystomops pustulosus]
MLFDAKSSSPDPHLGFTVLYSQHHLSTTHSGLHIVCLIKTTHSQLNLPIFFIIGLTSNTRYVPWTRVALFWFYTLCQCSRFINLLKVLCILGAVLMSFAHQICYSG